MNQAAATQPIAAGVRTSRRILLGRVTVGGSWACLALAVGSWAILRFGTNEWWLNTLLLYGPRWFFVAPPVFLLPIAYRTRRKMLLPLLVSMVVALGPVMGFSVPWAWGLPSGSGLIRLRVLTCNVNDGRFYQSALSSVVADVKPDIIALQEWPPGRALGSIIDHCWHSWQGHGLVVASRYPIVATDVLPDPRNYRHLAARCELRIPGGNIVFANVHLDTARQGILALIETEAKSSSGYEDNLRLRWKGSLAASQWLHREDGRLLAAGDFNMPVESPLYRAHWPEYSNAFTSAGLGWGHTKFTTCFGCRIDHVLAGAGWRCRRCWVGPDVGSDHSPVIADIQWVGLP